MTCSEARISLGAYVLGSLEDADRRAVAGHLRGCAACRAEHASLAGLPALLALVPADDVGPTDDVEPTDDSTWLGEPDGTDEVATDLDRAWADRLAPTPSPDLERRVLAAAAAESAAARRRRYRVGVALAAAGLVGAVGGGVVVAALSGADQAAPATGGPPAANAVSTSATDPVSGVTGQVTMTPRAWGTALALEVRELPRGTRCSLVVTAGDGHRDVAAGWTAVYERPARVQGATAVQLRDISSLEVRSSTGQTLVTWRPPTTGSQPSG